MPMDSILYLATDRIEMLPYNEEHIEEYVPKNIRLCNMVRKDENGIHKPFVVVDYYDLKGNPVCCMPYFGVDVVGPVLKCYQYNMTIPESWYMPKFFQYITVNLKRSAYRLFNHTDILRGTCKMEDIYSPAKDKNGNYILMNRVTFLVKCIKDSETGSFQKIERVQDVFNSFFSYCFEYELGKKRNEYLEMIKTY